MRYSQQRLAVGVYRCGSSPPCPGLASSPTASPAIFEARRTARGAPSTRRATSFPALSVSYFLGSRGVNDVWRNGCLPLSRANLVGRDLSGLPHSVTAPQHSQASQSPARPPSQVGLLPVLEFGIPSSRPDHGVTTAGRRGRASRKRRIPTELLSTGTPTDGTRAAAPASRPTRPRCTFRHEPPSVDTRRPWCAHSQAAPTGWARAGWAQR